MNLTTQTKRRAHPTWNCRIASSNGFRVVVRLISSSCLAFVLSGCPKGKDAFSAGRIAEDRHDFDSALEYYKRALQAHPSSVEYQVKVAGISFEAAQAHISNGQMLRDRGDLDGALFEFEKAQSIDPASPLAAQQIQKTRNMIAAARSAASLPDASSTKEPLLAEKPPELMPLSDAPINLRMTNDAKTVIETIAKLAGLTVIFDPDFPARRISVELTNVTLEQALEVVGVESKAFWAPMTRNIIIFIPDQPQKRRDFEDQVIRTFYLSNTVLPQELTEVVTGLRQLLDLKRIQQVNSRNAIVMRDTPAKLAIAEKFIHDIDTAQPEVVIQVAVLQVRRDYLRKLGISPDTSASLTFTPRAFSNSSKSSGNTTLPLNELRDLSSGDYSVQLPGATAQALLSDSSTQIIQDPQIRILDGQPAKLRIGDRVPVATGSFSAGTAATGVNPLVNTQFTYIDVGVNVDVTPHIHPFGDVSIKIAVEVSSVTGHVTIGSIDQPIISQRKIEHDVRLKDGEVNILGGLFDHTETNSVSGWPGLAKVPLLKRLFSGESTERQEDEILILLTPHVVRAPEMDEKSLRGIYSGTETNVQVRSVEKTQTPQTPEKVPESGKPVAPEGPSAATPNAATSQPGQLRFEPQALSLRTGESRKIAIVVDGARDLFSLPMLVQYDPAVLSVEEVRNGGFLSGGTQEIAIVERLDNRRGQAIISATRQPNTPGVDGTGNLVELSIKGIGPGTSKLAIVQVNARDSKQGPLPLVSSEASVRVQ